MRLARKKHTVRLYYASDRTNANGYNPADPDYGGQYLLKALDGTSLAIDGTSGRLVSEADRHSTPGSKRSGATYCPRAVQLVSA